jgi:hypothetical protein
VILEYDPTSPPPPPPSGEPVTLVAAAGVLDGTTGPQQWGAGVTIAALAPTGAAAAVTHTADGFGVQGGRTDAQLDHIPSNNTTEQFVLEFSGAVTDVTLRFGRMNPSEAGGQRETGTWTAYDAAGAQVANGALDPANGTQVAEWTYDIPVATAEPFAKLVVEATGYNGGTAGSAEGDSSDFALKQLTYALTSDPTGGLFELQGDQLVLI